jgi:hypothetical protein
VVHITLCIESNLRRLWASNKSQKPLQYMIFWTDAQGHRVDRGALGANEQISNNLLVQCAECTEKHSGFGARAQKTRLWVKKPMHFLLHGREINFG